MLSIGLFILGVSYSADHKVIKSGAKPKRKCFHLILERIFFLSKYPLFEVQYCRSYIIILIKIFLICKNSTEQSECRSSISPQATVIDILRYIFITQHNLKRCH